MTPRLLDAGDAAFTIEFGDVVDASLLAAVQVLDVAVARAHAEGRLPGFIEAMPTFRSLTIFFDPLLTGRRALVAAIQPLLDDADCAVDAVGGRRWRLPVCYEGDCGPDLAETARAVGARIDDVVAWHSATEFRIYMLGFLPGFPFMGDLDERLRLPRRSEPRVRVPAGSVSIAGSLTAIYPWESPGGWHLLGRCPVPLFDATRASPSLLAAGDRVRFDPVSGDTFRRIVAELRVGDIDPRHWQADADASHDTGAPTSR